MKGITYSGTNQSVFGSFQRGSHENLSIDAVASVSGAIQNTKIILSLAVAAHVRISDIAEDATVADMVLPAGVWPMLITEGSYVSLLKLTGSDSGQASVIIPK